MYLDIFLLLRVLKPGIDERLSIFGDIAHILKYNQ
jgi:hypothetical protein